jgi:hypothetical protein
MSGDFGPDLDWSYGVAGLPFWEDVYRQAFPGFVAAHIPTGDGWHQRAGRDRIIVLDDSSTITVDEKGRRDEWPDILVEILSDRDRKVPGWGNPGKRLSCDYIGYAFVPSQTCHLVPYRELRRIMAHGPGRDWWREAARKQKDGVRGGIQFVDARNPRDVTKPVRYWTRSIAVPTKMLLAEIARSLTFTWTGPEPQSEQKSRGSEEDWPPMPDIPKRAA